MYATLVPVGQVAVLVPVPLFGTTAELPGTAVRAGPLPQSAIAVRATGLAGTGQRSTSI